MAFSRDGAWPRPTPSPTSPRWRPSGPWHVYEVADAELVAAARQPARRPRPTSATGRARLADAVECPGTSTVALGRAPGRRRPAGVAPGRGGRGPAGAVHADPVEVTDIEHGRRPHPLRRRRPGAPVLVKASYFPNWEVSGAEGPYRVAPNLMVVVPTDTHVELHYGWTPVDLARLAPHPPRHRSAWSCWPAGRRCACPRPAAGRARRPMTTDRADEDGARRARTRTSRRRHRRPRSRRRTGCRRGRSHRPARVEPAAAAPRRGGRRSATAVDVGVLLVAGRRRPTAGRRGRRPRRGRRLGHVLTGSTGRSRSPTTRTSAGCSEPGAFARGRGGEPGRSTWPSSGPGPRSHPARPARRPRAGAPGAPASCASSPTATCCGPASGRRWPRRVRPPGAAGRPAAHASSCPPTTRPDGWRDTVARLRAELGATGRRRSRSSWSTTARSDDTAERGRGGRRRPGRAAPA